LNYVQNDDPEPKHSFNCTRKEIILNNVISLEVWAQLKEKRKA